MAGSLVPPWAVAALLFVQARHSSRIHRNVKAKGKAAWVEGHLQVVESLPHVPIGGEDDGFQSFRHVRHLHDTNA